jgi:phosphoglycolate phosphatase-like HAD superfamily hydrolase
MTGANGNGSGPVAVVFDIDGTLLTTGGAGAKAWGRAFEELYGVSANIEDFTEAGMPDQEVGRVTFVNVIGRDPGSSELAKVMSRYLHHLPAEVEASPGYRILPGVTSSLRTLCRAGYLLGLTTGNVEAAAHIKLERGDLNSYFCFGGYGSDSPHRGELTRRAIERAGTILGRPVDPRSVLVVGDTPRDVEAARYAGAVSVAVASGHFTKEQLAAAGADHVLGTLDDELPLSS